MFQLSQKNSFQSPVERESMLPDPEGSWPVETEVPAPGPDWSVLMK